MSQLRRLQQLRRSAFNSIAGGPLSVFIDFETDKFGAPILSGTGPIAGDAFSDLVTFSSEVGTFGGSSSTDVDFGDVGITGEIGPVGGFTGILAIDFLNPVSAFGLRDGRARADRDDLALPIRRTT